MKKYLAVMFIDDEDNICQVIRFGFKSKTQLPLFMIWKEYRSEGKVDFARVIFST